MITVTSATVIKKLTKAQTILILEMHLSFVSVWVKAPEPDNGFLDSAESETLLIPIPSLPD
jgi:hypothetical protein